MSSPSADPRVQHASTTPPAATGQGSPGSVAGAAANPPQADSATTASSYSAEFDKCCTEIRDGGANLLLASRPFNGDEKAVDAYLRTKNGVCFGLATSWISDICSFLVDLVSTAQSVPQSQRARHGLDTFRGRVVIPFDALGADLNIALRYLIRHICFEPSGQIGNEDTMKRVFKILRIFKPHPVVWQGTKSWFASLARSNPIGYVNYALSYKLDVSLVQAAAFTSLDYSWQRLVEKNAESSMGHGSLSLRTITTLRDDAVNLGVSLLATRTQTGNIDKIELPWVPASEMKSYTGFMCAHSHGFLPRVPVTFASGETVEVSGCTVLIVGDLSVYVSRHPVTKDTLRDFYDMALEDRAAHICPLCARAIRANLRVFLDKFHQVFVARTKKIKLVLDTRRSKSTAPKPASPPVARSASSPI